MVKLINALWITKSTHSTKGALEKTTFILHLTMKHLKKPIITLLYRCYFNIQIWNSHYCRQQYLSWPEASSSQSWTAGVSGKGRKSGNSDYIYIHKDVYINTYIYYIMYVYLSIYYIYILYILYTLYIYIYIYINKCQLLMC